MKPLASPPPSIQSSLSSATTYTPSFDAKRQPRLKESQFVFKHGQRHHSYDPEKAPYPVSYDKHVLELETLDNRLVKHLRGTVSFVNFNGRHPERSLDLGCGTGAWVIDAAKEWPHCEFVGFDLVNIQIPLKMVDPSIAERITWVHGNFLTTKLPFEDDEFDHVHIQSIARAVPENKWGILFEEISRVLRHGGSIEVSEDDITFPTLPRWFTAPLRVRPRRSSSAHFPAGDQRTTVSPPPTASQDIPPHDHALLESLYKSVFESRFINLKPTAVLPSYLTTYFRQVTLGPVLSFPMPPLPPLQPLPQQIVTTYTIDPQSDSLQPRSSTINGTTARPISLSFSSTVSASTISTADSSITFSSKGKRAKSASFSSAYETSASSISSFPHADNKPPSSRENTPVPFPRYMIDNSLTEGSSIVSSEPQALLNAEQLTALNERSLAMHLYRAYQGVLACREAMWEELKDRLRNRRDELKPYGWDDDEELEELQSRKKFERLIERYRSDMQARIALWCSLCNIGWPFPPREPLSKAELIEEERIREGMLEARKYATPDDLQAPCRSVRVIVGYKACS